jgi:hypothetical protein
MSPRDNDVLNKKGRKLYFFTLDIRRARNTVVVVAQLTEEDYSFSFSLLTPSFHPAMCSASAGVIKIMKNHSMIPIQYCHDIKGEWGGESKSE